MTGERSSRFTLLAHFGNLLGGPADPHEAQVSAADPLCIQSRISGEVSSLMRCS